jgi:ring-1,2-phenylacetyl-CoA epoxidase subunit PaaC
VISAIIVAEMTLAHDHRQPLAQFLLAIADDKLMLGHRNSDWTGLGPILEEDIAFSSIAQDEIAHAQALYELAGTLLDATPDQLAFGRAPENYRCAQIVEPGDEFDWAIALIRQLFCDHFDRLRLDRLSKSSYKPLADLARRLRAEEQVHVEHADTWVMRLGQGTSESRERLQRALEALAPMASSLFEPVEGQESLETAGVYPARGDLFMQWRDEVTSVLSKAGLTAPLSPPDPNVKGGRRGVHTPAFSELLDEMCEVYRIEPGTAW